jgi:hypothetical protein
MTTPKMINPKKSPMTNPSDDPLVPCPTCNGNGTRNGEPKDAIPAWAIKLREEGGDGLDWATQPLLCRKCKGNGTRPASAIVLDALLNDQGQTWACNDCGDCTFESIDVWDGSARQWCMTCQEETTWHRKL